MIHILLHFFVPFVISLCFFKKAWFKAYGIMMLTMLIDLDHLLATPIYDPNRCSIGFHPLHQPWFIALYVALCFPKKVRLIGVGCVIHICLDWLDCYDLHIIG